MNKRLSLALALFFAVGGSQAAITQPSSAQSDTSLFFLDAPPAGGELQPANQDLATALDLIRRQKFMQSQKLLDQILAKEPNNSLALELKGTVLALQGKLKDGLKLLQKATQLAPTQSSAWTKQGDVHTALKEPKKAFNAYKTAVGYNDNDSRAHQRLGLIYQEQGEVAKSIEHLEKGLANTPEDYVGVKLNLAEQYVRNGESGKAIKLLSPIIDATSDNAVALVLLANAYVANQSPEAAIPLFQKALKLSPKQPAPLLALGIAQRDAGQLDNSLDSFNQLLKLKSDWGLAYFQRALTYVKKDEHDKAVGDYQKALKDKELPENLAVQAGDYFAQSGKHALAEQVYKDLMKHSDTPFPYYQRLGSLYQLQNDPTKAKAVYRDLLKTYPDNPQSYLYAGSFHAFTRDYAAASDLFDKGLELSPDSSSLRMAKAVALKQLGTLDKAQQEMEILVKNNPESHEGLFLLGSLYEEDKKTDQAIDAYRRVLRLNDTHLGALNNLAYLLGETDKLNEAEKLALQAAKLAPINPTVLDTLGWIQFRQGKVAEAETNIGKAYQLAASNPTIIYHYAKVKQKSGQVAEAQSLFKSSLRLGLASPWKTDAEKQLQN
ncbi:tetratricopeptide repeat protein [Hahella aquimaris]|uniref:tetratricopeptide repeat protein n=1 Tax=Hahella sp. HNIBRBA332 TaxID=3015983 RepID=UPI00273C7735|nr:tetratricopeptide repeat protein [Hahella sp. HNIBRBA332]WLQ16275.1 tetratricopeptide repeat protein [Hahella sp. HNIBRBA332]